MKMRESRVTKIVSLICISTILGPVFCVFHIMSSLGFNIGSGFNMMAVRSWVFSFLRALRTQELTLED